MIPYGIIFINRKLTLFEYAITRDMLAPGISITSGYIRYYPAYNKVEINGLFKRSLADAVTNFELFTLPADVRPVIAVTYTPIAIAWSSANNAIRATTTITTQGKVSIHPAASAVFTDAQVSISFIK